MSSKNLRRPAPKKWNPFRTINDDIHVTGIAFDFKRPFATSLACPVGLATSPEWPIRRSTAAAYPISRLRQAEKENNGDQKVQILAAFKVNPESVVGIALKENRSWIDIRANLVSTDSLKADKTIHTVLEGKFQISSNGISCGSVPGFSPIYGYLPFNLYYLDLWKNEVDEYQVALQWQYRLRNVENAPWINLVISTHTFYLLLDAPKVPWGTGEPMPNQLLPDLPPKARALSFACYMAKGSTTAGGAALMITNYMRSVGYFKYDLDKHYTRDLIPAEAVESKPDDVEDPILFLYSAFMDRMIGNQGTGEKANCTDFAYMLMLLGNALGAGLNVGKLTPSEGGTFATNPVIVHGATEARVQTFADHEIAFLGNDFDDSAMVYDASLGFEDEAELEQLSLSEYLGHLVGGLDQAPLTSSVPNSFIKL